MDKEKKYFTTKVRPDTNDYVVYLHRNPISNQVFYVGIGNLQRSKHFGSRSPRWKAYVNKYGNPIVEIYKDKLFEYEATYLESFLIKTFGIKGFHEWGILVNLSHGGWQANRGVKHSQETREKLSKSHTGKVLTEKHRLNIVKALINRKATGFKYTPSKETRKKMSAAKKGVIPASARKVINEKTGEIFPSGAAAAISCGYNVNYFVSCVNGHTPVNKTGFRLL